MPVWEAVTRVQRGTLLSLLSVPPVLMWALKLLTAVFFFAFFAKILCRVMTGMWLNLVAGKCNAFSSADVRGNSHEKLSLGYVWCKSRDSSGLIVFYFLFTYWAS